MANPEHLKILKEGVEAWNKWRDSVQEGVWPDLNRAKLPQAELSGINLSDADLKNADLKGAILRGADLCYALLNGAKLSSAKLSRAVLGEANLHGAKMDSAELWGADLSDADLSDADLSKAILEFAHLSEAKLSRARLVGANLAKADLTFADLSGADLSTADLIQANLLGASLRKANMKNARFSYCNLVGANFTESVLTGAILYGTSRDDWIIKGVDCKYVYWDFEGKQRSPKDRELEPGEFERLYAALPTIEYIFEKGMTPIDPLIMDRVVQAIRERRPEFDIKIDSINARSLAPSIKFSVQHEEHKELALDEVRKGYDERINRLEAEKDRLYDLLSQAIDKAGDVRLITGNVVAMDNATIHIEQHIHNALELQKAIAYEPGESESFAKVAKKTALDIIGGAIKDIAKGQVKKAAKEIIKLGKDLGPLLVRMAPAAYEFFRNIGT